MEDWANIPLLVIAGPTASGKTALAVEIARQIDGEVVSADSMQVYRGMDIATAKPTEEETRGVPHHLIGIIGSDERFSVARYAELAHAAIHEIHARGRRPMLVGGTGLYIQAVTENLRLADGEIDPAPREALAAKEPALLWEELRAIDPETAERVHPNDKKRVLRALELYHSTGVSISEQNARSRQGPSPYQCRMLLLNARDRQVLYHRADARVHDMLARGLLEEAKEFWQKNNREWTSAQAIGYKELLPYLRGECSLEAAVDKLKRETRRYAKRQLSWFRRMAREWNERVPGSCRELYIEDALNWKEMLNWKE
ncbi:MAG: tRNA (adenosine(37)-N6)-dimethylallyltransferase MiaA [Oscillospiraceae bacterium]|nr:tRNA (adenosine(37)-N6)-dimethylallyltransferase MiaA [Oscillospiraceae bacterium]